MPIIGDINKLVMKAPAKLILLPMASKVTKMEALIYVINNGAIIN